MKNERISFMKKLIFVIVGMSMLLLMVASGKTNSNSKGTNISDSQKAFFKEKKFIPISLIGIKKSENESISEKKITKQIESMTLDEKIGQVFFVRVPAENQQADIQDYHLGGYLLFGRDYENQTPDSLKKRIKGYQEVTKIPLLIGSDEEGGTVSRMSRVPGFLTAPFASPQDLYKVDGMQEILKDVEDKSEILKSYGINVNLAPIADVSTDSDSFIYDRTIGLDARGTSDYVTQVVKKMHNLQIGNTLKHFPGYGDNRDSHVEIVHDTRTLKQLEEVDYLPFKAGIKAGTDSILVSHNIIESIDPSLPASISPAVNKILRKQLGFDGVVMTDDLDMAGIADFTGQNEAALSALKAGNDLVLTSTYSIQIPYIKKAIENGEWSEESLDVSVKRVLRWKQELGLIP